MGNNLKNRRKRGLKKVFSSLTLQTYQTYIQEAFKVLEWLSMTFLASFLKTETLVMENYCPNITEDRRGVRFESLAMCQMPFTFRVTDYSEG